ncbi:MAG TPA: CheR family methyltransferase [Candidatus Acidoferrum sp.]|nr:CheR family methyltransferase [Candidatus Acidoferrum sp.]
MTAAQAPSDVLRFRDLVGIRLGLHFDDGRLDFLAEVLSRQRGSGAARDYLRRLEREMSRHELTALAQELTIPETYFFRHIDQFRAFSEVAVPDRLQARRDEKTLRILSAGCASGEEPYTLAIAIRELALGPGWNVSIRGVDMNRAVLERAARARFSSWALRETPPALQSRWFSRIGREFQLDESIAAEVVFEQRNLADGEPDLWSPAAYDVVFCRNVIMYFTPATARAAVERIARSLAPGGYLFLGHAETLRGMSNDFHLCHSNDTFYYRRKGPDEAAWAEALPPPRPAPAPLGLPIELPGDTWVEAIGKAADRITDLICANDERAAADRPEPSAPAARTSWDLRSPLELLRQERFGDALALLQALPPGSAADPDVRLLEAVLLAHRGEFARAEEACRDLLELDELHAGAHYVLALCCEGSGDGRRATEHDQIASYLDPAFAMPRLHLGLLARRAGEHADARRELGQALALLEQEDSSRLLFFGGGFGREALVALCRAELVACGGRP